MDKQSNLRCRVAAIWKTSDGEDRSVIYSYENGDTELVFLVDPLTVQD